MTILEKVMALPEITPQTVKEFKLEEVLAEIEFRMFEKPANYNNISTLFLQLETEMEDEQQYDIFKERVLLQTLYLYNVYEIPFELINTLVLLAPLVILDIELNKILRKNDEVFVHVYESFKEYKVNNATTLSTIIKHFKDMDLAPLLNEFKNTVGDLNKIANTK